MVASRNSFNGSLGLGASRCDQSIYSGRCARRVFDAVPVCYCDCGCFSRGGMFMAFTDALSISFSYFMGFRGQLIRTLYELYRRVLFWSDMDTLVSAFGYDWQHIQSTRSFLAVKK